MTNIFLDRMNMIRMMFEDFCFAKIILSILLIPPKELIIR